MKRLLTLFLIIITIFSLFAVGCTKTKNPAEPKKEVKNKTEQKERNRNKENKVIQVSELFPVNKGWSWDYKGEGNEYAAFTRKVVYTEGNRAQLQEDNGGTVTASVFQVTADSVTRIFFTGENYEEKNYLNTTPSENLVIIKGPVKVGTKWDSGAGVSREILDTKATVSTPAGKFSDCIKIKITEENSTSYEYYKSGTGLVLREFISGETKVLSSLSKLNTTTTQQ